MTRPTSQPQAVIAGGIEEEARFRREKAVEYPDDYRNVQCAEGLDELAAYVRRLPDDDERLRELMTVASNDEGFSLPSGAEYAAQRALSQFRFHNPTQDCDAFLSELVTMATRDAVEFARFAGVFDEEDEHET